jgi:hypothetical protein
MTQEWKQIELTPELAAQLLAHAHEKQRRPGHKKVTGYARALTEGRWRLNFDPILCESESGDGMWNGSHRCAAVVQSGTSMPVYIVYGADPSLFDVTDTGNPRTASQFLARDGAAARAQAARIMLWSRDQTVSFVPSRMVYDLSEVMAEGEARDAIFREMIPAAQITNKWTGIPMGLALAAYGLARVKEQGDAVASFVAAIADPNLGGTGAWLQNKYRLRNAAKKRHVPAEDWSLLVRSLNNHIEGLAPAHIEWVRAVLPEVGETAAKFRRRCGAAQATAKYRRQHPSSRENASRQKTVFYRPDHFYHPDLGTRPMAAKGGTA